MHDTYSDIIGHITSLIRSGHAETRFIVAQDGGEYPCDETDPGAECSCCAKPLWWDENGAPRFAAHHPNHCPDIYANEVALLRISCQGCGHEFLVQMSKAVHREMVSISRQNFAIKIAEEMHELASKLSAGGLNDEAIKRRAGELERLRGVKPKSLADVVRDGSIHYGDPPNVECCHAGPTMNCWDLAVVEFWTRTPLTPWVHVPELEIELPDATKTERTDRL